MAATTQMNVRIDQNLKIQGDQVLSRLGFTPTEFIRTAWSYLVKHQTVPEFAKPSALNDPEDEIGDSQSSFEAGAGLAIKIAREHGLNIPDDYTSGLSYDELKYRAYLDRQAEKAARS